MYSGRLSSVLLLSALLLVGQWPLSAFAETFQDDLPRHCHAQADGGDHCGADQGTNDCHAGQSARHSAQGCTCDLACGGCSGVLAAAVAKGLLPYALKVEKLDPALSDGLISRAISPAERPPRPLL